MIQTLWNDIVIIGFAALIGIGVTLGCGIGKIILNKLEFSEV